MFSLERTSHPSHPQSLDVPRFGRMVFLGTVMIGPTLHFWYNFLSRIIPATTTVGALSRVALDQTLFAPSFIVAFYAALMTLEGKLDQLQAKLRAEMWPTLQTNWLIWIPAMFLNFRFVPLQYQVLASNVVSLVWNTYLSWRGNADVGGAKEKQIENKEQALPK